ncbi:MAG: beta-ketoacyl-ACP synthase II [Candidatus Eisenbacteria bacterium]|uniref:3-oxoacyl-[acyl-carrier-protein] synthase 2 n=1 Tax=Eiseniibacteriota bacterium TaxID=2212470 RepID=A0A933SB18_UNCEI|nr:beta-ketoacyl-ACP synthase II [Candidatus Eisenbacteria bacterium]
MAHRVVVTGLGVCASNGLGVPAFRDALAHGRSGIAPITRFDASALRSRIAGEVKGFDARALLPAKVVKRTARFTQLALVAAHEALAHAALPPGDARENAAVVVGTGVGGFDVLEEEHAVFLERGPGKFAPLTVPVIIPDIAAGVIAMETGCRGPNLACSSACATGASNIGTAFDLVRSGRCEVALAGSTESTISPFAIDGYCQLHALSTRNDDPAGASRPFSADRDGFVIAEGAGVLVLESEAHAARRGARVLAELAGYGASADGHHLTSPDPAGRGAVRAMRAALADAGLAPSDITVVNAHGTSTPLNDPTETRAIREVFGAHAGALMVQATKSMTGHALGAAAAIEAVASVLALVDGVVHPTINLDTPDPECDLDYVPNRARRADVRAVMSNAFGFGGHNAVLVFRRAVD